MVVKCFSQDLREQLTQIDIQPLPESPEESGLGLAGRLGLLKGCILGSSPSPPCSGVVDDKELEIKLDVRDTGLCAMGKRPPKAGQLLCSLGDLGHT